MSTDRLKIRLNKIEATAGDKPSMVLRVDRDGRPLPGQNVGTVYAVMPSRVETVEEWLATYAPRGITT